MVRLLGWVFATGMLVNSAAFAGWNSGGGALLKDGENPWFIQNTRRVEYCIQADPAAFHQDLAVVDQKIGEALEYWKDEFSRSWTPEINRIKVASATQEFVRTACAPNTDLVFQMGILTPEQIRYLGNPRDFVSVAVRTDYDPVQLRGKGFIYIAADTGPLRPAAKNMLSDPWRFVDGGILYRVLVHELGHVFGLKHASSLPEMGLFQGKGLMSASYPELIVDKEWGTAAVGFPLPNYFAFAGNTWLGNGSTSCARDGIFEKTARFFGIPAGWTCYQIKYDSGQLTVHAQADLGEPMVLIGTAEITGVEEIYGLEQAVTAYLTEAQRVFPVVLTAPERVGGALIKYTRRKGVYRSTDGTIVRSIGVNMPLGETFAIISGVLDGTLVFNTESWIPVKGRLAPTWQ